MCDLRRVLLIVVLGVAALSGRGAGADEPALFHPAGHPSEGLPVSAGPLPVYADAPEHPLNRLHRLLYVRELTPEEVQAELPSERAAAGIPDDAFFVKDWYFRKRPGTDTDRQTFGGDVRVSPVQTFSPSERAELLSLLKQLADRRGILRFPELHDPLTRLLLQWDVANVWWKLEQTDDSDRELLIAMARTVAALAQERETLRSLPDGLDDLRHHYAGGSPEFRSVPYLPAEFPPAPGDADSDWIEVGRKSSALFRSDRSLHASRTYLHAGPREQAIALIEAAAGGTIDSVPDGTMTGLVQTLIGFDIDLSPVATPVVDDVRLRIARRPFELSPGGATSSRDGLSHWSYLRTRFGSTRENEPDFRFVPDSAQALFTEYGSLKHATYAAQCTLCHRTTNSGGQAPAGIRMLSRYAQPHPASADERTLLAETEAETVAGRLRSRLRSEPVAAPRPETLRLAPRALRADEDRKALAAELRAAYSRPANEWPAPHVDPGVQWRELGMLPSPVHPVTNPYSPSKEQLGKSLFFDPRISGSGQIACASCHDPDLAWADGRTSSFGHARKLLSRNAPSIRNTAFLSTLFWDGRAGSLEEQAEQVLLNPDEMHAGPDEIVRSIAAVREYRDAICDAFGDDKVTFERIAMALACYQRTIRGGSSAFDAFLKGNSQALSDEAIRGLDLFRREARCINCHNGPALTDGKFHDVGLSYYGRELEDLGRYQITGVPADVGRFRTPSLRDVTSTAPYMHNGLFELSGVLNMYNAGMPTLRRKPEQADDKLFPTKSPHLRPLGLNRQDLDDLAAFLKSLEEPKRRVRPPELPGLHRAPLGVAPALSSTVDEDSRQQSDAD